MALDAGVMSITIEFAKDLKDSDWFGKQDPYCVVRVGGQTFRTRTAVDGGKSPVWNETFKFNIINENNAEIDIKDSDVGRDDFIGTAVFSLARARQAGTDRIQVPVIRKKSRKQHGFVSVALHWAPNSALHHPTAAQPQYAAPGPYAPPHAPPAPYPSYYPAGAPPQPAPGGYYPPPPQYYPAPVPAPQAYPPQAYPPQPYAAYPAHR